MEEFFQLYIQPVVEQSSDIYIRNEIRESTKLNELLYDNQEGIRSIFEQFNKLEGSSKGLTLYCAKQLFTQFIGPTKLDIQEKDIERCFVHSIMTITQENKLMTKYSYLIYIEFQEMLCRLAYLGLRDIEKVEFKVYFFLEMIWEYQMNENAKWQDSPYPLKKVNINP